MVEPGATMTPLPAGGAIERKVVPYAPDPVAAFFVGRVKQRVTIENRLSTRWALERGWYENILFIQGNQWLAYVPQSRQFMEPNSPRWFPKPVDNQMWPRAERMQAQFLKRKPAARVRPNSDEPQDQEAARDGDVILAHVDDVVQESKKRELAAVCVTQTGTVISKEWYNVNAGPEIAVPRMAPPRYDPIMRDVATCPGCGEDFEAERAETACPSCAVSTGAESPLQPARRQVALGNGTPAYNVVYDPEIDPDTGEPAVDRFREGEIESEIILPFDFYLDEQADSLDAARWCAHVTYRDIDWIDTNYPEVSRYIGEQSGSVVSSFYRAALLNAANPAREALPFSGSSVLKGGAFVIDYEERASRDFPQGLRIVVINNVLAFMGPLPLAGPGAVPEFSYSMLQYSLVPGSPWGATPITQMIPLQKTINGIRSQIIWNRKTMLVPWLLAPDGCGLKAGDIALVPAAVVPYQWNGLGTAPQIVPGQPLPSQIIDEWRMALDSLDRIAATGDEVLSRAGDSKSGIAFAQLAEMSETSQTPRMNRWENWIAERGRKRLLLAQQYYREPRMMKVLGAGSVYQVRRLTGADLRGNTDVTVEAGSSLPRSRTAQVQLLLDLLQTPANIPGGFFGADLPLEPGIREQILQELGFSAIRGDLTPDRRRALNENAKMDAGQLPTQTVPFDPMTPTVGQFEDREMHLKEHLARLLDPRFDQLPPQAQQAYIQHVHETRIAALIELKREALAPGALGQPEPDEGPPPPGEAPPGGGGPEGGANVARPPGARQSESSGEPPAKAA